MNYPDVVLIVLDTQRADRLGCYGYQRDISPNLDRFARQSVLFEQAVSPAQWTIPSHGSLFTGLYPTAHGLTQSSQSLSPDLPHIAEILQRASYETIGYCNNPLVGILNNGFKRGFDRFYNYGGAIPSLPPDSSRAPWPLDRLLTGYTQFLRRISYPVQNFFGRSDLAFRLSLNAWLTPLWSRFANFKGQNARSVKDVAHFLEVRERGASRERRPLFLFLNLMETHLPFWPPGRFVDEVAPYYRHSADARKIMQRWNREAYRWAAPLAEPLGEMESRVLNDMYDAEVAFQDDYLGRLFQVLDRRQNRDNTLTIIVSDHGDGLGEHSYFGHAFVAYQELIHVPLLVHWPRRLPRPDRIGTPVSTRRVFHTIMEAITPIARTIPDLQGMDIDRLTLLQTIYGRDPEKGTVFSEIYPPLNFVKAIERRNPQLLDHFHCLSLRRAVVSAEGANVIHKLIRVDNQSDELYNLEIDPLEVADLASEQLETAGTLARLLEEIVKEFEQHQKLFAAGETIDLQADERLRQQLRGLGYID